MSGADRTVHLVIMGVAGCGKSAVGQRLAALLNLPLIEGDDFHPAANVQKMQQGIALDDADRHGWLQTLAAELARRPHGAVLTCSALKASYRNILRGHLPAPELAVAVGSSVGSAAGSAVGSAAGSAAESAAENAAGSAVGFVYLAITPVESLRRVAQRAGHFYPPSLVASQFEALQDPSLELGVLTLDGIVPLDQLAERAADWVQSGALIHLAPDLNSI